VLAREGCYSPFEILDRIGPITYMIALPDTIKVYNVFQVPLLKKRVHAPNHVVDWALIQVESNETSR
jgi:hypothetical protein